MKLKEKVKSLFGVQQKTQSNGDTKSEKKVNTDYSGKYEMIERKVIEKTPFMAVRFDKEWALCLGNYRLKSGLASEKECRAEAEVIDWERIMQVVYVMMEGGAKPTEGGKENE